MSFSGIPQCNLSMWLPRDYTGTLASPSEVVAWNLAQEFSGGANAGFSVSGLVLDPSGGYLTQQPQYVSLDADETQWTKGGLDTGTYTHGTNPATGKMYLYQTNGSNTVQSSITYNVAHAADVFGGFEVGIYRAAPSSALSAYGPSAYSMYVYLNDGAASGLPQFRVAIECGNPIRLDMSSDGGATWTATDTATTLGDSEAYLTRNNRQITIDVMPLFDLSYWADFPSSFQLSDDPPDKLFVIINNGDAVLTYSQRQGTFAAGNLAITTLGGQWECGYAKRQYVSAASAILPTQVYPRPFATNPTCRVSGYVPYRALWAITPVYPQSASGTQALGNNQVYAEVAIEAPAQNIDPSSGFSTSTVAISAAQLEFPPVFNGPSNGSYQFYFDQSRIRGFIETHVFDQANFLRRSYLQVMLTNDDLAVSPGAMPLAARVATFNRGWYDPYSGYNDVAQGFTGLTTFGDSSKQTFQWEYQDKLPYLTIDFTDRFIDDQPIGFMLPMDGQCHYYVMRQCGYRLGFTDAQMIFPYCTRNSNCSHYHLPSGTTYAPLFQPHPAQSVLSFMLQVRKMAGDYDPAGSGAILPMYLMTYINGTLAYFPAPVGIVNSFAGYANYITPGKTYSAHDGTVNGISTLSQISRTLRSSATLSNIRTSITLEGLSPVDGGIAVGWYNNPNLDGSAYANPWSSGYIGIQRPYIDISKLYSSYAAVQEALTVAVPQLSFPAINSEFTALLQSTLLPVTGLNGNPVIAIQDFATQGNTLPVPYYPVIVQNRYGQNGQELTMETNTFCRYLGQA